MSKHNMYFGGMENANLTPSEIAHYLIDNVGNSLADKSEYTIVILGKPGPRGKTWLRDVLRQHGFTVVEISEDIYQYVNMGQDERNHCIVDVLDRHITIILNSPMG